MDPNKNHYDLALVGGHCLTLDPGFTEFSDVLILVKEGRISFIGPGDKSPAHWTADKTINTRNKLILPAFINAHTHLSLSLYRGLGTDLRLHDWLQKVIWPLEREFCNPDNVYLASCLSLLEMIRSGTATVTDMNFFSGYAAKAIDESGLRGFLGEALFSSPTPSIPDPLDGFNVVTELADRYKNHPLIHSTLALHAPFTCSDSLYSEAFKVSKKLGIKLVSHVAETRKEVDLVMSRYGQTPVQWLHSLGILYPDFIAVHAVHLTDPDIEILAGNQVSVIHNPHSNMMLGSGICRVTDLLNQGIRVGIGTDSASSNNGLSVLTEMQTASRLQKLRTSDPSILKARDVLRMSTAVNASILGLSEETGVLKAGSSADLIIVDANQANMLPVHDWYAQIVYSMENHNIESLVVHGKVIMEEQRILTLDEERIIKEVKRWTQSVSVYDFIQI